MNEPYRIPFIFRVNRVILRVVIRLLFHILGRVEIGGLENIPPQGPYMIAINHLSIYEGPLVVAFWPVAPEVAGAAIIWERPGQSLLARLYRGIPVRRGQYDRKFIESLLAVLQSGYPLLIAPEGGRSHTPGMRRALPGVAYFMDKAGVPVVPVGVFGSTEDFFHNGVRGKRPVIGFNVGEPFDLPPVKGKGAVRRESRQRNADLVMTRIAALLPADYRGVYADPEDISPHKPL